MQDKSGHLGNAASMFCIDTRIVIQVLTPKARRWALMEDDIKRGAAKRKTAMVLEHASSKSRARLLDLKAQILVLAIDAKARVC